MSILSRIFGLFKTTPEATKPAPLPEGKLRLQLMCGDFASEAAAKTYCYDAKGDAPEQITREQPDAFIDTGFVEVAFGTAQDRLAEFLTPKQAQKIYAKMKGANTLIIITDDAFGGFPYALVSTAQVTYLGPIVVDV